MSIKYTFLLQFLLWIGFYQNYNAKKPVIQNAKKLGTVNGFDFEVETISSTQPHKKTSVKWV
jgi:hypothetical protein